MGFTPTNLSQNIFKPIYIKGKSLKNSSFYGIQTHDLITKFFSAHEISNEKAYKIIMPFMGFEPMTLSQNILQPIIYQRKKALKFWLSWDTNP